MDRSSGIGAGSKKTRDPLGKPEEYRRGEAEAIALALQVQAGWLLTDDAKARQLAETLKLEVHGSIGLLLWNLAAERIDGGEAIILLEALAHSTLWISERVLSEARQAIVNLSSG